MAQIMFIVWACSQKNVISIFPGSKCSGSLCCRVQAVRERWEHLGCRSSAVGIGKEPSVGLPATALVQLPAAHLI